MSLGNGQGMLSGSREPLQGSSSKKRSQVAMKMEGARETEDNLETGLETCC